MESSQNVGGNLGSYTYSGKGERTIGDVLKDLVTNIQDIVRSEIQLAKIELRDEVKKAKSAATLFGAAAALGFFGVGFCLLAVVYALTLVLPAWAAALITGVVLLAVAGGAFAAGRNFMSAMQAPEKTKFTVKQDVEWIKNQNKS